MTLWVKCLLHRPEASSSDPQHAGRKAGLAAHTYNPRTVVHKQGVPGSHRLSQLAKTATLTFNVRLSQK